jgi:RNA polymerase sigma factor (sigma-70 family)
MDDLKLWKRLKNGEHAALKEIYDQNIKNLENYALKFSKDIELVEDTLHDIFVQIWNKRETLSETDSIIKYLCVTLRRELIRRVNKAQLIAGFDHVDQKDTDFSLNIEDIIIQGEMDEINKNKLQHGLSMLSSRQREAIFFRYYECMEYEEICTIMDINYQSVRNLISKGIIELRNHFTVWLIFLIIFLTF